MLKDKFAFIDEATTTAIRNEQDELRMHGATRTLQTLCSSLPSGINAERVTVRNLKISAGAGFIVALTGEIMTMPGLPKVPAAERIDVDETGKITGLF